jgi:hypothetical protein
MENDEMNRGDTDFNNNNTNFGVVIDEHWCCVGHPRYHDPVHPSDIKLSVYDSANNRRLALIANSVFMHLCSSLVVGLLPKSSVLLSDLRTEWQRTGVVVTGVSVDDFSDIVLQPGGIALRHGVYVYILDRGTFCLSLSWILMTRSIEVTSVIVCL